MNYIESKQKLHGPILWWIEPRTSRAMSSPPGLTLNNIEHTLPALIPNTQQQTYWQNPHQAATPILFRPTPLHVPNSSIMKFAINNKIYQQQVEIEILVTKLLNKQLNNHSPLLHTSYSAILFFFFLKPDTEIIHNFFSLSQVYSSSTLRSFPIYSNESNTI